MNKKQTLFEQRTAMKALRNERLAAGMCQECGERPRTENLDNTKSVHCQPCKDARQKAAWTSLHGPGKRPPMRDGDGDLIDDFGYLDTPRFYAYCESVKRVIYRASFSACIGDMRRMLGDNFVDRMHADALDYLMASGEIRERQAGAMQRYEPAVRHEREETSFGRRSLMLPGSSRSPIKPSFEDRMAA